tara:strand:+ start:2661 stop:2861 length:201 start_codon:yes stop_codon:yes gene_type:complete
MPKLIINRTIDEFFVTDSWKYYRDNLPEKNIYNMFQTETMLLQDATVAKIFFPFVMHLFIKSSYQK